MPVNERKRKTVCSEKTHLFSKLFIIVLMYLDITILSNLCNICVRFILQFSEHIWQSESNNVSCISDVYGIDVQDIKHFVSFINVEI